MAGESGKLALVGRGPAGVIALLIGLGEVLVTTAAIKTSGWIQGLFSTFAVLFITAIALGFFHILKSNPLILVPPESYTQYATLNDLADAMHKYSAYSQTTLSQATRISAEAGARLAWSQESPVRHSELENVVERAVKLTEDKVAQSSITVDISQIAPEEDVATVLLPVDEETEVSTFLNQLYVQVSPHVRPFTYGERWILKDANGKQLQDMGALWAREHMGTPFDPRRLSEFGVKAGVRLTAIEIPERDDN
ncbi:hypothetical protein ACIRVK_02005 [Streptomyces sp. NPDC101152]|uniref:hypothetical protein n=1 Tax=Streptomyces sp. NPDC101152 TaxID=3366116 RepID=UPI003805D5CC